MPRRTSSVSSAFVASHRILVVAALLLLGFVAQADAGALDPKCTAKYLSEFISSTANDLSILLLQAGTYADMTTYLCNNPFRSSVNAMMIGFGKALRESLQTVVSLNQCIVCSAAPETCPCTMSDFAAASDRLIGLASGMTFAAAENDSKIRAGCVPDMIGFTAAAVNDFTSKLKAHAASVAHCS